MFAIIFWEDDDTLRPVLNKDGTLTLFDALKEADEHADSIECTSRQMCKPVEARVISIDGVRA